jgi:hypothetical protein
MARLHGLLRRHVELITSGVPVPRIILSEDVFTGSPQHRKRIHSLYHAYLDEIRQMIEEGQSQGLIRRELGAPTLALMWLGLVQSPAILWLLGRGQFDLRQHCDQAWKVFATAIQPDRPLTRRPNQSR